MLNNLPKPVIIGVTIVVLAIALVVIFRTLTSGGENAAYGSKADIEKMQQEKKGGGRQMPTSMPGSH